MNNPGDRGDDLEFQDPQNIETWEEEEQLVLADEDEDLPWLEADEYEEERGFDWGFARLLAFAALALALALAAIWWFTRERPDPAMVPDGSTIEAPDGAYKERPTEPGGEQVEGTDSQAFQAAEGQQDRGIVDGQDGGDSPRPAIDREQSVAETAPATAATETGGSAGNVYVQIGAFGSQADAEAAWRSATSRFSTLSGMRYRVVEGDVNGATVFRLQAIAGDRASADATCRAIRNGGGDCYIR